MDQNFTNPEFLADSSAVVGFTLCVLLKLERTEVPCRVGVGSQRADDSLVLPFLLFRDGEKKFVRHNLDPPVHGMGDPI